MDVLLSEIVNMDDYPGSALGSKMQKNFNKVKGRRGADKGKMVLGKNHYNDGESKAESRQFLMSSRGVTDAKMPKKPKKVVPPRNLNFMSNVRIL